jgi:hypothetical protein
MRTIQVQSYDMYVCTGGVGKLQLRRRQICLICYSIVFFYFSRFLCLTRLTYCAYSMINW